MAVTDRWLQAQHQKVITKELVKSDRDGLVVRVSPKGKLTFAMRYYFNDSRKRLDLGSYPLMSLKEARQENLRLRKELEQGHDPKVVRQLEKQKIIAAETLTGLFDIWYDAYCVPNKKGHHDIKRSFEIYVFPRIGHLPADKITLHEWLDILEPLAKKVPAIAERVLVNAKQLLKYAVKRRLIASNVLADIFAQEDLQVRKRSCDRVLDDEELKMMWLAVEESRITPKNRVFTKLCLIYACRNGELRLAEKEHFDFEKKIWTIPPENHKLGKSTGKPLLRPIIPETESLLREAFGMSEGSHYVFTNDKSTDVMGTGAPLHLPYNLMQYLRRHEGYELAHFSMHDLRRSARTQLSQLVPFHIAEIMLGHSIGRIVRTYDRHHYLKEQAEGYEKWCKKLFTIVGITPEPVSDNNVISFEKARKAVS